MEARFHHSIKNKKRLLWLFISQLWDINSQLRVIKSELCDINSQLRVKVQFWGGKKYVLRYVLRITSLYHAIMRKKSQNYEFVSRNYEKKVKIASLYHAIMKKKSKLRVCITQLWKKSQNCEFVSRNYEKKSQNCEIKSRNNLFYFLFSGRNGLP